MGIISYKIIIPVTKDNGRMNSRVGWGKSPNFFGALSDANNVSRSSEDGADLATGSDKLSCRVRV